MRWLDNYYFIHVSRPASRISTAAVRTQVLLSSMNQPKTDKVNTAELDNTEEYIKCNSLQTFPFETFTAIPEDIQLFFDISDAGWQLDSQFLPLVLQRINKKWLWCVDTKTRIQYSLWLLHSRLQKKCTFILINGRKGEVASFFFWSRNKRRPMYLDNKIEESLKI